MRLHLLVFMSFALLLQSCSSESEASRTLPVVRLNKCISEDILLSTGIVGGTRVYQNTSDADKVMMLFSGRTNDAELCTATAIGPNVLLTAAHCIVSSPENSKVVLHSAISCESGFDPKLNTVDIQEFIVHPDYSMNKKDIEFVRNDMALIILKNNLPSRYKIHKIANPDRIDPKGKVQFLGYGVTKLADKGNHGTGMLRKAEVLVGDIKVQEYRNKVEVDQSNGQGICSGDSGGPALVRIAGEQQILGVNSYVDGGETANCENKGVLALAYPYVGWIEGELRQRNRPGLR